MKREENLKYHGLDLKFVYQRKETTKGDSPLPSPAPSYVLFMKTTF